MEFPKIRIVVGILEACIDIEATPFLYKIDEYPFMSHTSFLRIHYDRNQ